MKWQYSRTGTLIIYRLDRHDEVIGPLLCMCDPSHPIEELSAEGFEKIVRYVNEQRAHLKYYV